MAETVNSAFMGQPAGGEDPSLGDDRIRAFKNAWKERIEKEHYLDLTEAGVQPRQGLHKSGSAVAFYQASAPTQRNGVTLGASDTGLIWIDSDDMSVFIWNGTVWKPISPRVDLIEFLNNAGAASATMDWNESGYVQIEGSRIVTLGVLDDYIPIVYTAGNIFFHSFSTFGRFNSTSYVQATNQWTAKVAGTVRVKFSVSRVGSSGTAYARPYKNGVAVGTEITNAAQGTPTAGSDDITVAVGDVIDIRVKISNSSYYCGIRNAWLGAGEAHETEGDKHGFFKLESTAGFSLSEMGLGQVIHYGGILSGGSVSAPSTASSLYWADTDGVGGTVGPSGTLGSSVPMTVKRVK